MHRAGRMTGVEVEMLVTLIRAARRRDPDALARWADDLRQAASLRQKRPPAKRALAK